MKRVWFLGVLLSLLTACANTATPTAPVSVSGAWVRASPMMDKAGAAYFVISNATDKVERLVTVTSPAATVAELHTSMEKDGMMTMLPVAAIEIPAKGQTELKPGSYHIMLIDLQQALTVGENITLTLTFENAGEITVVAPVKEDQ